jgi:hypothetical protein
VAFAEAGETKQMAEGVERHGCLRFAGCWYSAPLRRSNQV